MKHALKGEGITRRIWLDGKVLFPESSQRVWNHSPDGFNWGYGGSGPAQLALAICLELCATKEEALSKYQAFKCSIIATLPNGRDFEIEFDF